MIDTILFDMDGTLLDTLDDIFASVNVALEEYGLPQVTLDETREAAGYGAAVLMDETSKHAYPLDSPEFKELLDTFSRHYAAHSDVNTAPYDGVMDLLATLRARDIKMAVVSNKAQAETDALRRLWFGDYITLAVGLSDAMPKKPAPDMALKALDELGSKAECALYVGDSEPDAQIAKNSGCVGVSVLWGFRDRKTLEAQKPAYLIDRPAQVLDILDELNGATDGR